MRQLGRRLPLVGHVEPAAARPALAGERERAQAGVAPACGPPLQAAVRRGAEEEEGRERGDDCDGRHEADARVSCAVPWRVRVRGSWGRGR